MQPVQPMKPMQIIFRGIGFLHMFEGKLPENIENYLNYRFSEYKGTDSFMRVMQESHIEMVYVDEAAKNILESGGLMDQFVKRAEKQKSLETLLRLIYDKTNLKFFYHPLNLNWIIFVAGGENIGELNKLDVVWIK